jgi:hypothetical protein
MKERYDDLNVPDHSRTIRVIYTLSSFLNFSLNAYHSPGRIHHCMRTIGAAQNALDTMLRRVTDPTRKTFGKHLYEHGACLPEPSSTRPMSILPLGTVVADIAKSRAEIEASRLLVLSAAIQVFSLLIYFCYND